MYTCIIVDDETLARELIASHIAKIPNLEILAECANTNEAKFALEKYQPDILFLDIQMPHLNGLEFLRMLEKRPCTILTTAFSEHAFEGYELDVLDYLLKPIEFERFFKAVSKVIAWIGQVSTDPQSISLVEPECSPAEYFFVKSDYKLVKVLFDEILYVEALQKYVRIHTTHQRIVTLISMNQLEAILPKVQFVRIHRSFILNLDKIDRIEGNVVKVEKHILPISKGQKEAFLKLVRKKGYWIY